MATKTITTTYSDLSGAEGASRFHFGIDGLWYEIDLVPKEEENVRASLADIIGAARRMPRDANSPRTVRRSGSGATAAHSDRSSNIRAWARGNGFQVNDRGRISAEIVAAYDAAH